MISMNQCHVNALEIEQGGQFTNYNCTWLCFKQSEICNQIFGLCVNCANRYSSVESLFIFQARFKRCTKNVRVLAKVLAKEFLRKFVFVFQSTQNGL